jgi:hypothetical protein
MRPSGGGCAAEPGISPARGKDQRTDGGGVNTGQAFWINVSRVDRDRALVAVVGKIRLSSSPFPAAAVGGCRRLLPALSSPVHLTLYASPAPQCVRMEQEINQPLLTGINCSETA